MVAGAITNLLAIAVAREAAGIVRPLRMTLAGTVPYAWIPLPISPNPWSGATRMVMYPHRLLPFYETFDAFRSFFIWL